MIAIQNIPVPEIKLVYLSKMKPSERPQITSSKDSSDLLLQGWDMDLIDLQEQFKIILLNRRNKVLGIVPISSGGLTHTYADTKLILAAAIIAGATGIILAHNHPSGSARPSRPDEAITENIKVAARYHDLKILDHIIVTSDGYFSFADEGLL